MFYRKNLLGEVIVLYSMTGSNYPPDHDPRLDSGEDDEIEEVGEYDDSDEFRENAIEVCKDIGLPEDEAELMVDDFIQGY